MTIVLRLAGTIPPKTTLQALRAELDAALARIGGTLDKLQAEFPEDELLTQREPEPAS